MYTHARSLPIEWDTYVLHLGVPLPYSQITDLPENTFVSIMTTKSFTMLVQKTIKLDIKQSQILNSIGQYSNPPL